MAGPYCLSVIYRVICICWSQTHNPSLPYPLTWQSQVCSLCLWACLCFVDIFICIIFQIPNVSGKFLKNIQMNEWVVGLLQWHKVSWLNDKFSRRWHEPLLPAEERRLSLLKWLSQRQRWVTWLEFSFLVIIAPSHNICTVFPEPRSNKLSYPNIVLPILIPYVCWPWIWKNISGPFLRGSIAGFFFFFTHRMIKKNWDTWSSKNKISCLFWRSLKLWQCWLCNVHGKTHQTEEWLSLYAEVHLHFATTLNTFWRLVSGPFQKFKLLAWRVTKCGFMPRSTCCKASTLWPPDAKCQLLGKNYAGKYWG